MRSPAGRSASCTSTTTRSCSSARPGTSACSCPLRVSRGLFRFPSSPSKRSTIPRSSKSGGSMADVVFEEVDKVYDNGVQAVFDLTLDIHDGEFLVLVGPSGCGKTTALRMVAGLEDISAGTLKIGGRVVNDVSPKERDIAMVFQNYALYPHLSVAENIAFGLRLRKAEKSVINERVAWAAKLLDLVPYLDRRPKELSGGRGQRGERGRGAGRRRQVSRRAEPLSNLDAKLRVQMRADI